MVTRIAAMPELPQCECLFANISWSRSRIQLNGDMQTADAVPRF